MSVTPHIPVLLDEVIAALAIAAYMWMGGTGNASTTTPAATGNADCVAQYQAEYSSQWANMSLPPRALKAVNCASCAVSKIQECASIRAGSRSKLNAKMSNSGSGGVVK